MTHGASAMKHELAASIVAGLMLAQMNSYNGGIPITPGTSVPESSPATAIVSPPSSPAAPASPAAGPPVAPVFGPDAGSASVPAGPAYSFGAAPAPVVAPGR